MTSKAMNELSSRKSIVVGKAVEAKESVRGHTRPIPIKGVRRNLGRQARKRRKKFLEIEAAASAFVTAVTATCIKPNTDESSDVTIGNTENAEAIGERDHGGSSHIDCSETAATTDGKHTIKPTVLPTDRGYVMEDVKKQTVLSERDRCDLIRQLGYLPGNALQVVARVEDAFSSDELERLFASMMEATLSKTRAKQGTRDESTDVADVANRSDDNLPSSDSNGAIASCHDGKTNEGKALMMNSMIQNMMKEPLVIKLYPLVLRDESSSTKRRRKRRREEKANDSRNDGHATNTSKTPATASTTTSTFGAATPTIDTTGEAADLPRSSPLMEPFPTIYWVTHPLIKTLISKLELDRVNVQFEQLLLDDETGRKSGTTDAGNKNTVVGCPFPSRSLASMKRAHKSYGKERRELLSPRDIEYVKGRNWYSSDDSSSGSKAPFSDGCGVAGIRNPKAVKCLHAHAAHYWSGNTDNIVGRWVWERLNSGRSFFSSSITERGRPQHPPHQ